MTNETEFGTYTRTEVEQLVAEAVEDQRSASMAACLVFTLLGFMMGLALGWLAL